MKSYKDLGKIAGLLFLVNLIPYVIAQMVILDGLFYVPNYLEVLSSNRTRIGIAVLLQFISITAMIAFAVHMFSILREFGNKLSLGYLGLRFVEFGIIVFSITKQLSLFEYSQLVKNIKFEELPLSQLLADSMLQELEWIGIIYMLVFVIHCVIFYYLLFKSNLVPKIISIGGLIATLLAFTNIINHLFNLNFGGFFLFAPIGIVELILAFWILLKGFKKISAE
ncbi:DUF4386 domain-containing protein [Maribacter sp. IgM3_T14_3]|uniref:DUF4386 domain-containing protein n=1 Tax=Maribacter sp. IgM3_T14_3 TaxID=3415140 RepID=UPI003C6FF8B1